MSAPASRAAGPSGSSARASALDEVEPERRHRARPGRPGLRSESPTTTSSRSCTPRSTGPATDVNSVIHGHPLYGTALGPRCDLPFLTHDAVLFTDGLGIYDEGPVARHRGEPGSRGRGGARRTAGGAAAQPRRRHRRRGRPLGGADGGHARTRHPLPVHRRIARCAAAHPGAGPRSRSDPRSTRTRFLDDYWAAWVRRVGHAPGPSAGWRALMEVAVTLNGRPTALDVEPQELLLDVLRDRPGPHRRQALLRRPGVRHLHRARRRRTGERMHLSRRRMRTVAACSPSRASGSCEAFAAISGRVRAARGRPVRLLHARDGAHHPRPARQRRADR